MPTSAALITAIGSAVELQTPDKGEGEFGLTMFYCVNIAPFVRMICTDDEATLISHHQNAPLWASKTPARSTLKLRPEGVPSTAIFVT